MGANEVKGLRVNGEGTSWEVRGRLCVVRKGKEEGGGRSVYDVGRRIREYLREGR